MGRLKTVCFVLYVVVCYYQTQGADKYTDENRPYEFGFTIDGEQHRHEKKDENGIIMGEFGFITADGVYHVTVYATDENGNFKIISMKNIRVKPYPTAQANIGERKGHSLSLSPSPPSQIATSQIAAKTQQVKQESGLPLKSCSHCKVLTTTTTTISPPKTSSSAVLSSSNYNNYNAQLNIAGNSQTSSQNNNNRPVHSQYENSLVNQQSTQSNYQNSYQQNSILNRPLSNSVRPAQSYPNQAVNAISQEPYSQNGPSQQNYPQDDFNVGRQYLQKAKGQQGYQQTPNIEPNSILQSNVASNSNQPLQNSGIQQEQGIVDGQYNLQPPYENKNYQQTLDSPQSYPKQAGANVQELNSPTLGTNYPTSIAQSNYDQQTLDSPQSYPKQAGANVQDLNPPTLGKNYPTSIAQSNYDQRSNKNFNNFIQNTPKSPSQAIDKTALDIRSGQGDRQPKTFMDILQTVNNQEQQHQKTSQQDIRKPVLIAAQMQIVDKNTNIYQKSPGENEGLPKGVTKGDISELLYTFNYTVGFHGHHEEGYRTGAKIGYYYVTGRNGIRTRVDYVADETGFHPRISQEILDIQSDEVPKPETEKDEKYGLKGYEFKWLYYPVESK